MNLEERKLNIIAAVVGETDQDAIQMLEMKLAEIDYDKKSRSKIIGLNPKGMPIIKSEFVRCIHQSLTNLENGEWITLDDLEKRSENW
ncbi:MAG: hypothetical protein P8N19_02500 [Flavobacteriales bacterium]|jgi:phosphohistidine swiveling domain-containing protein|nr:hypothetical protein [Flavobacteriales bacterium]MDG1766278.1 hypothetical protein [Flavobacteriales bacterium]